MPIDLTIRQIIQDKGYIPIDDVMRQVLSDNSNSYYRNIQNIGQHGDFITAPEVSQLFGEMIALWLITKWQALGRPANFCLLELGPGHGTLMQDILRISHDVMPEMLKSANICLYEINPYFVYKQQEKLQQYNINWINNLDTLPDLPLIIIANEFFDAMPIKQYIKIGANWQESVMIVDPISSMIKYSTVGVLDNLHTQFEIEHPNSSDCAILEESIETLKIVRLLSRKIDKNAGNMLLIDYGYYIPPQERISTQYLSTLQAIKNHQYVPIIDYLGEADLSAHVDFYAIEKASSEYGNFTYNFSTQGSFLKNYGIDLRAAILKQKSDRKLHNILDKQLERLTCDQFMGDLFKVLEITKRS